MESVRCSSCKATFEAFPCHIRSGNSKGTKCEACRPKKADRRKRVDVLCAECSTPLHIKQSVFDNNTEKRFYCNRTCMGAWRSSNLVGEAHHNFKEKIEVRCIVCSTPKLIHESHAEMYSVFFCSDDCKAQWHKSNNAERRETGKTKVKVACATCNKPKFVAPSQAKAYERFFCDQVCLGKWRSKNSCGRNNPNWAGGGRTDPVMLSINKRMAANMRSSLGGSKSKISWQTLVGYDVFTLRDHLAKTLPKGFDWNDFLVGLLHIDHKRPIASFRFASTSDLDFLKCWALDNLQLLPALENMRKGAKLNYCLGV